jgi:hypothetical protein
LLPFSPEKIYITPIIDEIAIHLLNFLFPFSDFLAVQNPSLLIAEQEMLFLALAFGYNRLFIEGRIQNCNLFFLSEFEFLAYYDTE